MVQNAPSYSDRAMMHKAWNEADRSKLKTRPGKAEEDFVNRGLSKQFTGAVILASSPCMTGEGGWAQGGNLNV